MSVYQIRGSNHYYVKTFSELLEIMSWADKNDVKCLHESSGIHGYGFSISKHLEWFLLKWT